MKHLKQFENFGKSELDYLFTGAVWSDGKDHMELRVTGETVYGSGNDFDFERDSKEEALAQLKQWGYRYIGAE